MPRYECSEGGSSKFWEISVDGSSFTTRHGRIGASGTANVKSFASVEEAERAAAKLVQEKVQKGYRLVGDDASTANTSAPATAVSTSETPKKRGSKAKAPAFPSWPGIEDRTLKSLAKKLERKWDPYRINQAHQELLEEVLSAEDWETRHALLWHLVTHGLLAAAKNAAVLELLGERPELAEPPVVIDLLTQIPAVIGELYDERTPPSGSDFLENVPWWLDRLVFHHYHRAPDSFLARQADFPPNVQLALAFVRGRDGETLPRSEAQPVLESLARVQARRPLNPQYRRPHPYLLPLRRKGEEQMLDWTSAQERKSLALCFGTPEEWLQALLTAALGKPLAEFDVTEDWPVWCDPEAIADLLVEASLQEFRALLRVLHGDVEILNLYPVLARRKDAPEDLLALCHTIQREGEQSNLPSLGLLTMVRFVEKGQAVPEDLNDLFSFDLSSGEKLQPTARIVLDVMRRIPKERTTAMAEHHLTQQPQRWVYAIVAILAHFDQAQFTRFLSACNSCPAHELESLGEIIALLGPSVLLQLEQTLAHPSVSRPVIHHAILNILAAQAQTGEPTDPHFDPWIRFDTVGGQVIDPSWHGDSRQRFLEKVLKALPEDRAVALLLDRIANERFPGRPLRALAAVTTQAAVIDEGLRLALSRPNELDESFGSAVWDLRCAKGCTDALVAALGRHIHLTGGSATVLKFLERQLGRPDYESITAALTAGGGRAETKAEAFQRLADAAAGPKSRMYVLLTGEAATGVAAQGVSRAGGAANLPASLIPQDGDSDDEPWSHLFTLDLSEMPELAARFAGAKALACFCPEPRSGERNEEARLVPVPTVPTTGDGTPVAVLRLDVPVALFDRARDTAPELKKMLYNDAAGHVLGGPLWIQEAEELPGDFLLQVNEGLAPNLNLGDRGSLYIFEGGAVFQCS